MDPRKRTWIVVVLLGTAVAIGYAVMKQGDDGEQRSMVSATVELRNERMEPANEVADEQVEVARPVVSCRGNQLQVDTNADVESVCLGTLTTKYNGSVRSHQVATLATPQRWLRVEVAGGTILSAAWGGELRPDFYCQGAACKGITISRRDARGARVMTLERTQLMRAPSNEMSSVQASLQLSGQLTIPPEELPEFACADQGVSIVTSDSSSQTFCPLGGAGFELADDGTKRYRFTSLDGESIVVATDQDQQIRQVQFDGEVSLACRSFGCGSVRISAADVEGARRFTFAGTTLIDADSGQTNAVLNGSLILPPL
ncbi:MAG TPA: hypothetical protein VGE08_26115 [Steroidobacter sp.]|uniref:hypothetical protein n=1 Tax=Steroidobacter sp. TaxID=1978227 RepID=UPI002EDB8598